MWSLIGTCFLDDRSVEHTLKGVVCVRHYRHHMTRHVLIATGINSVRDLAFAAGGGSTVREAACTHGVGLERSY